MRVEAFPTEIRPLDYGGPVERPFEAFPDSAVGTSIIARFKSVAARFPDRVAIQSQSSAMTYRELSELASRIGFALASATKGSDSPVGIMLDRDTRYPAAMLGVLSAGSAYATLNASHPFERNRTIVERAGICTWSQKVLHPTRPPGFVHRPLRSSISMH